MYSEYFRLKEPSFSITPDPQYLFLSEQHREALAHLLYGAGETGGFVLLTGEVGAGKTTVCRAFLEQIPESVDVALILNPAMTVTELLRAICEEFGVSVPEGDRTVKRLVDRLNSYLLEAHANGRRPLLMIDEAQNLRPKVLEQIRLLTNLETAKHKLLQIFLVGQPELQAMLQREGLRQLNQRITARYHLRPFNARETADYIRHRLAVGGVDRELFTPAAHRRVYRFSRGVPRLINILCDRALLGAFVTRSPVVTKGIVARAAEEVRPPSPSRKGRRWTAAGAAAAVLVLAAGVGWQFRDRLPLEALAHPSALLARWLPPSDQGQAPDGATAKDLAEAADADKSDAGAAGAVSDATPRVGLASLDRPKEPPPLDLAAIMTDQSAALARVLRRWGIALDELGSGDPCARLVTFGLRCEWEQGTWSTLKQVDRPAVLRLRDGEGKEGYAAVGALDGDSVLFDMSKGSERQPIGRLADHWTGDYMVVWQPPPVGTSVIGPGASAEAVRWLRKLMAQLPQDALQDNGSGVFDDTLAAAVRRFQTAYGLAPDGIAGPKTLIRLNNVVAMPGIPRLSKAS